MQRFAYRARDRSGHSVQGFLEAESPMAVADQLSDRELIPVRIWPVTESRSLKIMGYVRGFLVPPVRLDDVVMFCRQIRTLLKSGVPILRALRGLAETTRNPRLKDALFDVYRQLQEGRELYTAFAQHPGIFSPLFQALVQVGEQTGRLEESFSHLADYLEREKLTRERIRTAMRYPMIVLGAIVIAMIIINLWVIPSFASVFVRFDAQLPLMTRILMATSDFMQDYWQLLLAILGLLVFLVRKWIGTAWGNRLWSRWILHAPLIGPVIYKSIMGRFTQALSMTLRSGLPLVSALKVVSGVVDNLHVAEKIHEMRKKIEKGKGILQTAVAAGLFPPLVLQMLATGEETGALDDLLQETAAYYESEVDYDLKRLTDAIEPIVIVIMGLMVTVLALGVFLPLWDLSSSMGH